MADTTDERLTRLEELAGFAEHDSAKIREGLAELLARVDSIDARLRALEQRLGRLEAPIESPDDQDA
ncbi:MAG: hypothetical protein AAFR38_14630 [Planctomycetota bacterium]